MSFSGYHLAERLIGLRVREARRQTELRCLQREARRAHRGLLPPELLAAVPVGQSLCVAGGAVAACQSATVSSRLGVDAARIGIVER
jgi:hypothetical protein